MITVVDIYNHLAKDSKFQVQYGLQFQYYIQPY